MSSNNIVKERIIRKEVESRTKVRTVSPVRNPSDEEVRRRAFEIHIERGGIHGCDLDDWIQAEEELTEKLHR